MEKTDGQTSDDSDDCRSWHENIIEDTEAEIV